MRSKSELNESQIHPISPPNLGDYPWTVKVIGEEIDYLSEMLSYLESIGIKEERYQKEKQRLDKVEKITQQELKDQEYITKIRRSIRTVASPLVKLYIDSQYKKFKKRTGIEFRYKVFQGEFLILPWSPFGGDFSRRGDPVRLNSVASFLEDPEVDVQQVHFWVYGVGDEGMPRLSRMVESAGCNFDEIAVENDRITSVGLQEAANFVPFVRRLKLGYNNSDKDNSGFINILESIKRPDSTVEELDFAVAGLGDEVVENIIDILNQPSLRLKRLNLGGNKFSREAVEALQKNTPINSVSIRLLQQEGWGRDLSYLV